jgi:mannose-6-phosphate isomerase-like protein (cupin superfamily)/DNA-binding Xre family transcriptional regulator
MATPPDPSIHPAAALRAARTAQGLTLRDLAARTGMPVSTLSKLENGKTLMTYDKLLRLAQGLGIDLAELLAAAPAANKPREIVGRRSISRSGKSWGPDSDRHTHHYPAADLIGKLMTPILIEVTARSVEEMGGLVRHSGEEYLYILSGAMELHSDLYAPLPLAAGDSIYFDSGMAHAYVRTGKEPCRVLSVCAGEGLERLAKSTQPKRPLVSRDGEDATTQAHSATR